MQVSSSSRGTIAVRKRPAFWHSEMRPPSREKTQNKTVSSIRMTSEKATYILTYFNHLMSEKEKMAWKHWSSDFKTEHSSLIQTDKQSRKNVLLKAGWLTTDPEILKLLGNGIEHFRITTATRISHDNPEVLIMNNCPNCGKLARTPFAKQCRYCSHNWHEN